MEIKKMSLLSTDIAGDNLRKLRQLFPSVFIETISDKGEPIEAIDFEKLKAELGTFSNIYDNRRERYGLDWPGKKDALRIIQKPSNATLKPVKDESVNFDKTQNLFIEGDNLEVLKLLQKSYYGKIKVIYIDPPYNTGKEFIYPDNYNESLDTYLAYAGLVDEDGRRFSTNTQDEGRYHTKWLNMMYPRLYLAKNLLRDDGVIFLSIDEHESANLKMLCNEIFGEENLLNTLIWHLTSGPQAGHFTRANEFVLAYAKNIQKLAYFKDTSGGTIKHGALKRISNANPASEVAFPKGSIELENGTTIEFDKELGGSEKQYVVKGSLAFKNGVLANDVTIKAGWAMKNQLVSWLGGKETFDSKGQKVLRFYFNSQGILFYEKERGTIHPKTVLPSDVGNTKTGTDELINLLGKKVMDFPKPSSLIRFLIQLVARDQDLILDFFAGSATAAQAVLDLNKEDGGNRKFIMIQLPELTKEGSEAYRAGYKTVADIGKERIRRVIEQLEEKQRQATNKARAAIPGLVQEPTELDLGFKVFKLDKSNFKTWDGLDPDASLEKLTKQLELHIDHVNPNSPPEDILYELLLKAGFMPTEKVEEVKMAGKKVYSIAEGTLLICLEKEITKELINELAKAEPKQVICLDQSFNRNDQLKANAVHAFAAKSEGKEQSERIVFRTV